MVVTDSRPTILVCNDDGVDSQGIAALAGALSDLGRVVVVAPDRERSASGHALSLDRPLRCELVGEDRYAVDGTPADCVYLGFLKLCVPPPSIVVSGINHGLNLGADVFYSGTVAGAVEGALRGAPAIAFSMTAVRGMRRDPTVFLHAARFVHALVHAVLARGLPPHTALNVNFPAGPIGGYQWTRLGERNYRAHVDERADLRGRKYYWIGGPAETGGESPGTDGHAVTAGWASVTPLGLDLTHDELLRLLPSWELTGFEAVLHQDLAKAP